MSAHDWRPDFHPDPETLRWAAGQVRASGPHVPDTTPLRCAYDHVRLAAQRLTDHADFLELASRNDQEN